MIHLRSFAFGLGDFLIELVSPMRAPEKKELKSKKVVGAENQDGASTYFLRKRGPQLRELNLPTSCTIHRDIARPSRVSHEEEGGSKG